MKRTNRREKSSSRYDVVHYSWPIGKAIRQQEEQAKCQMYQLHSSLINIMDENKTLQNEIATIEHQMAVDATLHSQVCTILVTVIWKVYMKYTNML